MTVKENTPVADDPVGAPRDYEKAVSAAYLRLTGSTQEEAAESAGLGERTLRAYESCSWWDEVLRDASDRWLSGLMAKARAGLEDGVTNDGRLALSVLERLDKRLRPPKLRSEVTGEGGGPIQYQDMSDEEVRQRAHELTNRIAAITQSQNGDDAI